MYHFRITNVGLHGILGIICLGFLLPVMAIVKQAIGSAKSALMADAFPMVLDLMTTTLAVGAIAVGVAVLLGWFAAWAVTEREFEGRNILSILLCLPFAFPPYLVAGIYQSMHIEFPGLIPDLKGIVGAGVIFALTLYPWVYVPMKMQISSQSSHYHEIGCALGMSPLQRFWRIRLGLLAPTLGIVALLVLMEVLSDFGVVTILGAKTLSVGIHDAMFSMYRRDWAAQLSLLGLSLPVLALCLFAFFYRKRKTYQPPNRWRSVTPTPATGVARYLLPLSLGLLAIIAFILPTAMLVHWATRYVGRISLDALPSQLWDSMGITLWVTGLSLILALCLNILLRLRRSLRIWQPIAILANLNYAIPSVMLAIAVLFLTTALPQPVVALLLSESSALLVAAGVLTYTCFPFFSISVALAAVPPRIDDLCRVVGLRDLSKVSHIYFPILKHAMATGSLLILINMLKDLNLSQVLHPFGFQSLSMRLYSFAGMGMLEESALFALVLLLICIYPVATLDKLLTRGNQTNAEN